MIVGKSSTAVMRFKISAILRLIIFITAFSIIWQVYNSMEKSRSLKFLQEKLDSVTLELPNNTYRNLYPIDTWQYIGPPFRKHQIFSAYFDPRLEPLVHVIDGEKIPFGTVRVFAVLPLYLKQQIICTFRYDEIYQRSVKAYESLPIHEHFDMEFSAYIIACPLSEIPNKKKIILPVSVAITYEDEISIFIDETFVQIGYSNKNILTKPKKKIAACVGPLQQNYNEVLRTVEFIEIYRLLGIEKFYLYNLNSTEDIGRVLNYYEQLNIVQVINWNFGGYKFESEVRYNGILAAINECMYRATFVDNFKYVAVIDFDEILMPLKSSNLLDFVKENDNGDISAFIFRGTFFHKFFKSDYSSVPMTRSMKLSFLYTQVKIERVSDIYSPHFRSKYIANARSIIETGSHQVWRTLSNFREYIVAPQSGLLFHYRTDCFPEEVTCKGPNTIDYSARRFGSLLWNNVNDVCIKIFKRESCPKSDWE